MDAFSRAVSAVYKTSRLAELGVRRAPGSVGHNPYYLEDRARESLPDRTSARIGKIGLPARIYLPNMLSGA